MNSYEAYIEYKCSEYGLIDVYNFGDAVFHKDVKELEVALQPCGGTPDGWILPGTTNYGKS